MGHGEKSVLILDKYIELTKEETYAIRWHMGFTEEKSQYSSLDKAMEYIDNAYIDLYLYSDGAFKQVLADDILYIERKNRKVFVHTITDTLTIRDDYESCCQRLPLTFFYGVHKSFYVNLHYVQRYAYTELFLTDGTRISIASRKQAEFHKFWFGFLGRH